MIQPEGGEDVEKLLRLSAQWGKHANRPRTDSELLLTAADIISRLRAERDKARMERDEARRERNRAREDRS